MEKILNEFEQKQAMIQDDIDSLLELANRMRVLIENKEENLEKLAEKLKKYPEIQSDIVKFSVAGTQFATFRSTLTKKIRKKRSNDIKEEIKYYEPHLLECMVNGQAKVVKDPITGAIFIDRNPDYFKFILDYLRFEARFEAEEEMRTYDNFKLPRNMDADFKKRLIKEADYYNLASLKDILILDSGIELDSIILKQNNNNLLDEFNQLVKDKEQLKNKQWQLLYRATEDGFGAEDFHRKCDNKGSTLTIIKSRDSPNVFGGFTAVSWDKSGTYKSDPSAFIFSLINAENRPLLVNCTDKMHATYCTSTFGPVFGADADIVICSNANTKSGSHSKFSRSYKADGFEENTTRANNILAGSQKFFVAEIEVFQMS